MLSSLFTWGSKPESKVPSENPRTPNQQHQHQQPSQNDPPQHHHRRRQQQPHPLQRPNLKLLLGGMTFFALSLFTTRRALRKRHLSTIPSYYTSSVYHKPEVNGALDAFEALSLATLNVFSFGMMGSGAVLYKLDVNSLEDARALVRRVNGERRVVSGSGGHAGNAMEDKEAEEAVEKWVIETLGLKGYEDEKRKILEKRVEDERREGK